jgi:hypothetical protein
MVGTRAFLSQITIVLQIGFSWLHLQWSICCGCSRLLSQFLNCEEMHMEDLPVPVMTARNFSRCHWDLWATRTAHKWFVCIKEKADCVLLALREQVCTGVVGSVSCVGSPNWQKLKEGNLRYRKTKKRTFRRTRLYSMLYIYW